MVDVWWRWAIVEGRRANAVQPEQALFSCLDTYSLDNTIHMHSVCTEFAITLQVCDFRWFQQSAGGANHPSTTK